MLQNMRNLLLIMVLLLIAPVYADVYKSVDEEGNPVFTDKPSAGAEKIDVKEIQTIEREPVQLQSGDDAGPSIKVEGVEDSEETGPEELAGYSNLAITSPQDDETIRDNAGNVTVNVAVSPNLNISAGHELVLILDGTVLTKTTATSINTSNLDRGTHTISVAIVDREDKEILRSNAVTFHLQRFSALQKNQPPPPPPPSPPQPGP